MKCESPDRKGKDRAFRLRPWVVSVWFHALATPASGPPARASVGENSQSTRDWLANVSRRKLPSGDKVVRFHETFLVDLPALAAALEFDPDKIPYVDFERIVANWILEAQPGP